jgi:hypothetical protein
MDREKVKQLLVRVVWDYNIPPDTLLEIFETGKPSGWMTRDNLCARLLLRIPWYELLDVFGLKTLKSVLSKDAIQRIHVKEIHSWLLTATGILNGV